MRNKALGVILAGLMFLGVVTPAFADWSQSFRQLSSEIYFGNEVGQFDQMGIWWIGSGNDSKFNTPAFSNFSLAGWSNVSISNKNAFALGTPSDLLDFNINFIGNKNNGTEFLFMAALNGQILQRQHVIFDGTNWNADPWVSFPSVSADEWNSLGGGAPITPEPVSSMLFLLGSGVMAVRKFRKSKK